MPPILLPGEVVGDDEQWQVEKKIGEGRFSEVYEVLEVHSHVRVSAGSRWGRWRRRAAGGGDVSSGSSRLPCCGA